MKFSKKMRFLVLAGLMVAVGAGCAGFTGVKQMDDINVGGKAYAPFVVGHGDASGIDTKVHYLFGKEDGKLESAQMAADRGATKIYVPAAMGMVGDIGAGVAFGLTMPKTNSGGGGATVLVDNVNAQAQKTTAIQKSNLTAIQKTTAIQQQSINPGGSGSCPTGEK